MTSFDRTSEAVAHIEARIKARGVLVGIELTTSEVVSVYGMEAVGGVLDTWHVKSGPPKGKRTYEMFDSIGAAAARVVELVGWKAALEVK